jgi:hypothetical protein
VQVPVRFGPAPGSERAVPLPHPGFTSPAVSEHAIYETITNFLALFW